MARGSLNARPKPILQGCVVAVAGDLGDKWKDWHDGNLMRWLRNYGGQFSMVLDDTVTHILATKNQYQKKVQRGTYLMLAPIYL